MNILWGVGFTVSTKPFGLLKVFVAHRPFLTRSIDLLWSTISSGVIYLWFKSLEKSKEDPSTCRLPSLSNLVRESMSSNSTSAFSWIGGTFYMICVKKRVTLPKELKRDIRLSIFKVKGKFLINSLLEFMKNKSFFGSKLHLNCYPWIWWSIPSILIIIFSSEHSNTISALFPFLIVFFKFYIPPNLEKYILRCFKRIEGSRSTIYNVGVFLEPFIFVERC